MGARAPSGPATTRSEGTEPSRRSWGRRAQQISDQALGLVFQSLDVARNFVQGSQRLRTVKVSGERNLIAELRFLEKPSVGGIRHDLAAKERLDSARFEQRNLVRVS